MENDSYDSVSEDVAPNLRPNMKRAINNASEITLTNLTATNASSPAQGRTRRPAWSAACLLMAAALVLAGCGKGEKQAPPTPEDAKPIDPTQSEDAQLQARIAQAAALRDNVEPPAPSLKLRGGELATPEVLKAYNQELLRYIWKYKETPESMQELMRIRTLPRLPTAPPGKRIVYDPINRIIKLEP